MLRCLLALSLVTETLALTEEVATAASQSETIETVLAGWDHNYGILKGCTGLLTFRTNHSPAALAVLQGIAGQSVAGGMAAASMDDQLRAREASFFLKGNSIRFNGTFSHLERVRVIHDGQHISYSPNLAHFQIELPETITRDWRDPRQPFYDETHQWARAIQESSLQSAKQSSHALLLSFVSPDGNQWAVECDQRKNFLPVRCWELQRSDGRQFSAEIEYAEALVNDAPAWFPRLAKFKVWGIESAPPLRVESSLENGWFQEMTYAVSELKVGLDLPDDTFLITPPDGTYVADAISGTSGPIGERASSSPVQGSTRGKWLMLAVTLTAVVFFSYLVLQRRAHPI